MQISDQFLVIATQKPKIALGYFVVGNIICVLSLEKQLKQKNDIFERHIAF